MCSQRMFQCLRLDNIDFLKLMVLSILRGCGSVALVRGARWMEEVKKHMCIGTVIEMASYWPSSDRDGLSD